jgi:hypothetical protein
MPANLSPEYKAAEANFRKARDPKERLDWLREMLRVIPKHKGTDHLQGDIKRRIRELCEELEGHKKAGARGGPTIECARRTLSLHDAAPRAGDDALRRHPLSARRSAGDRA